MKRTIIWVISLILLFSSNLNYPMLGRFGRLSTQGWRQLGGLYRGAQDQLGSLSGSGLNWLSRTSPFLRSYFRLTAPVRTSPTLGGRFGGIRGMLTPGSRLTPSLFYSPRAYGLGEASVLGRRYGGLGGMSRVFTPSFQRGYATDAGASEVSIPESSTSLALKGLGAKKVLDVVRSKSGLGFGSHHFAENVRNKMLRFPQYAGMMSNEDFNFFKTNWIEANDLFEKLEKQVEELDFYCSLNPDYACESRVPDALETYRKALLMAKKSFEKGIPDDKLIMETVYGVGKHKGSRTDVMQNDFKMIQGVRNEIKSLIEKIDSQIVEVNSFMGIEDPQISVLSGKELHNQLSKIFHPDTSNLPDEVAEQAMQMVNEANLAESQSAAEHQALFHDLARILHPDTSGLPSDVTAEGMRNLNKVFGK